MKLSVNKFCTLVATATFFLTPMAQAQSRLDQIKQTHTIKLGHRDAYIPFSYLNGNTPVGYSMDICYGIVDAIKKQVGSDIQIKLVPVTPSTQILYLNNGMVDLVCGAASNNTERQKEASFSPTTFVAQTRFVSDKKAGFKTLDDLKGQTVTSIAGSSNLNWLNRTNAKEHLDFKILEAKNSAAAGFQLVQEGRAKAFFMDDVILAGLVATSHDPSRWVIDEQPFTVEPYAILLPKKEPELKKVVDEAVIGMMKDGTINKLYTQWFTQPIPPNNINLNLPMSDVLKKAIAHPTDSPDPKMYK